MRLLVLYHYLLLLLLFPLLLPLSLLPRLQGRRTVKRLVQGRNRLWVRRSGRVKVVRGRQRVGRERWTLIRLKVVEEVEGRGVVTIFYLTIG
jgi:hypothetical protein